MWVTTEQILWALRDQKHKLMQCHSADGQAQHSDVLSHCLCFGAVSQVAITEFDT